MDEVGTTVEQFAKIEGEPEKSGVVRSWFTGGDLKYVWAGTIAIFSLLGLTVTTVISMYHWPVDNGELLRQTNTTFGNVLTFVLGVFTGASMPAAAQHLLRTAAPPKE